MLKLEDYRVIFVAVGLASVLLFASPSVGLVLRLPSGEKFSEIWILGPDHMAEGYPHDVEAEVTYLMYLGVGNHMISSAYYAVHVKLRNQSEALPNAAAGTPSLVPTLYEYRVFLEEGKNWEAPLTFSFSNVSLVENKSTVGSIAINGYAVGVDNSALWDVQNRGYFYQLFMELWIYDSSSSSFHFHNRFVGVWLNLIS